jgi:hypothetical protein
MKVTAIWDMALCNLVEVDRRAYASLKRQSDSTKLHSAIAKKAVIIFKLK